MKILFLLLFVHFLADFPLQGDFLSQAKSPTSNFKNIDPFLCMMIHCFIQAMFVFVVTGSPALALIEYNIHGALDIAKCANRISFRQDQLLHILSKVIYTILLTNTTICARDPGWMKFFGVG